MTSGTDDRMSSGRRRAGGVVLAVGAVLIAGSALYLVLTGRGDVRYSANHDDTLPIWVRWLPALAGLLLARLTPPRLESVRATTDPAPGGGLRAEATVLLLMGVAFPVLLVAAGGGEPAHSVLKLVLLVGVPLVLFWLLRRRGDAWSPPRPRGEAWRRFGPALPVTAFVALSFAPWAVRPAEYAPSLELFALMLVVFAMNALLEEVFYRRWLQTRWEALLGPAPAIVLASICWAVWHVGIQGTGPLHVDLAAAVVNQGVTGLFLGYLWFRYRLMWPLLVTHGLINSGAILLGFL